MHCEIIATDCYAMPQLRKKTVQKAYSYNIKSYWQLVVIVAA